VTRLIHIALFLVLLVGPLASGARAQAVRLQTRKVAVAWSERVPSVSFSANDLADRTVRRRLKSGLPQTVMTRIYAYTEAGNKPIALSIRSCRVIYDLWEDVYRVQIKTERSGTSQTLKSIEAVQRACLQVKDQPVGRATDFKKYRGRKLYFAVIMEFNPLSDGTVERIRRWLARPSGSGQLANDAFFGSFVSIFVSRRIGSAERLLRFRSSSLPIP
jgi:hypothetical protein